MNIEAMLLDATIGPLIIAWLLLVAGAVLAAMVSR